MKPKEVDDSVEGLLRLWTIGALAAVVCAALLLASCENTGIEDDRDSPVAGGRGVTLQQIINEPEEFYGKEVTVAGKVGEVVQPSAVFTIGFVGPPEVVIVGTKHLHEIAKGKVKAVHEGDLVRVSGTVRPFKIDKIQRDIDYKIDTDEYVAGLMGGPAILARTVVVIPERGDTIRGGTT